MTAEDEFDADLAMVEGFAPPSARVRLSRELIIEAAIQRIDREGLAQLSMRSLAAEIGAEAMSLYRHVSSREDLLDAVVGQVVDTMYDDPDVLEIPEYGWQDFLLRLAHGIRRMALAHPKIFPMVASRPPEAPWLRPPLRSLRWVEVFLQGLRAEGFSSEGAVEAYRGFTSFLLGHLLLEVAGRGAEIGPLDEPGSSAPPDLDIASRASDLTAYPMMAELSSSLAEDHSAAEFEESLENLLNRLDLIRTRTS